MIRSKLVGVFVLSSALIVAAAGTSLAAGWQESGGKWQYINSDNSVATSTWKRTGDKSYYLGADGNMLADSFAEISGNYYYFGSDGAMITNEWREISDSQDASLRYWYYFGADGKALKTMSGKTYLREVKGKKYLFDEFGRMVTGFVTKDGDAVAGDAEYPFLTATYFFGEDGAAYAGQWYRFEGTGTPDLFSTLGQKDYSNYSEIWIYFGADGKKVAAANDEKSKVLEINGKNYSFDENGVMAFDLSAHRVRATASDAVVVYGGTAYDGAMPPETWVWRPANEVLSEDDFRLQEFSWWRTKSNGRLYKDGIYIINGRKYAFDRLGRMQAAFVLMRKDDGKFLMQYEVDDWSRFDFLKDARDPAADIIPGIDTGTLYFFSADEFNDGSLAYGGEYEVILADGPAVFGFRNSGRVYGANSTLERFKNKYYYNGLRLDASSDIGYGIVDIDRSNTDSYVVVDSTGRIVKGKKLALKDAEGYWILINDDRFIARVSDGVKPRWHNGQFYTFDPQRRGNDRYVSPIAPDFLTNVSSDFVVFEHDEP